MKQPEFTTEFIKYLTKSVTPFHAVEQMAGLLADRGFHCLSDGDSWDKLGPGSYFLIHNDSSLVAFQLAAGEPAREGFRMVAAHTDSPSLRIHPRPVRIVHSFLQLGVEVYGGALLAPWFDRDLSIAGRVVWHEEEQLHRGLIDFKRPVAIIPSLAIHLDREANKKRSIKKHKDIIPVLMQVDGDEEVDFGAILTRQIRQRYRQSDTPRVLDFDLFLYDTQPPALTGLRQEFITGGRLDNLISCFTALFALPHADAVCRNTLLILNDHEEVGSVSASGAQGELLKSVLHRLLPHPETRRRCLSRSLLLSADNAHGLHPGATDKFDINHTPLLNRGIVIKTNANQRYATSGITAAIFRSICRNIGVPVQDFVMRADMACGSTIGPITAAKIGVAAVDIGVPTLGMHSIRETAGITDCYSLYRVFGEFFGLQTESPEMELLQENSRLDT